jgi:hypothetical protein
MEQLFGIDGRPGVGLSMKGVSGGAGVMREHDASISDASINDVRIDESERRIFGPRPARAYESGIGETAGQADSCRGDRTVGRLRSVS